jgi:pimeloyl-ACP methyl ester carboxylesterase
VVQDLGLRFAGFVVRQCIFNTLLPMLSDAYAAAGIAPGPPRHLRPESDYFLRQATDADGLAAELDTPARRRRYVETFYGSRFWGAPGAFTAEDVAFHVEPFLDAEHFRASIANYEPAMGRRAVSEPVRFFEPNPVPTLVLYGPEDHVVGPSFLRKAEVAFPERIGPFVVSGAGHFLQWERADVFNRAMAWFLRDQTRSSSKPPSAGT